MSFLSGRSGAVKSVWDHGLRSLDFLQNIKTYCPKGESPLVPQVPASRCCGAGDMRPHPAAQGASGFGTENSALWEQSPNATGPATGDKGGFANQVGLEYGPDGDGKGQNFAQEQDENKKR